MKILITGCAGFIGSNFAKWLLDYTSDQVIGVDNYLTGYQDNLPNQSNFTFFWDDITNNKGVHALFDLIKPDVCYHFAAYAAEGRSNYIRNFIHSNNTASTANVINACVNHKCKLVFTSSVAVYSGTPPFDETMLPNPIDAYGVSKYCSEMDIRIAGEQQGLDWCIIRPRNVYGPGQSLWDKARNVMGIWCYQALHGLPLTVYGDGSNKRCFTYIDDILRPLYNARTVSKEIINLGASTAYSIKDAVDIFGLVTKHTQIDFLEPRHEVKEATCLIEKSASLLKYMPHMGLTKGIVQMWEWAKKQPDRQIQQPPALEILLTNHSSIV